MKKCTFTLFSLFLLIAGPAMGAVNSLHLSDGSVNTFFRIELSDALSGAAPNDITSIAITGPDGPLSYTKADFIYSEITNLWRGFYLIVEGAPKPGSYQFTISSGATSVTTDDTQATPKTIPIPDKNTFSVQGNSFSWSLVDLPGADLYYILQINIADASGGTGRTVYYSSSGKNGTSMNVPQGVLIPGQSYKWRVRVMDAPDWVSAQNEAFSAYAPFTLSGISMGVVRHREYGDGTSENFVQFQLKDGSGQNVTRSLSLSNIKVYDPTGEPVNLTDLNVFDVSVATYNSQTGQWNYPQPNFDPYGYAIFSNTLVAGTYRIEVVYNGETHSQSVAYSGPVSLPFIDPSSFNLSEAPNGDLTWSWTLPSGNCPGTVYPLIRVDAQGQTLGFFFFSVPTGQCIRSLLLPASFVQMINTMSDQVRLSVIIRTNDQNNDTVSSSLILAQLAPPALSEIHGKVTDALTGEPVEGASISLTPGSVSLISQDDGTFSSSSIPAATYSAEISATNYNTKTLSGIKVAAGVPNQLNVSLTPYAPQVTSPSATPNAVGNDGQSKTLLTARVTHPMGPSAIISVLGDLSAIGGSDQQLFYDDATHGDLTAGDGIYSFRSTVKPGTQATLYSLKVTAYDVAENQGFGFIPLNVIDKVSGVVQPGQTDSKTFVNPLVGQTLNIHYALSKTVSALKSIRSDCEVQLTILRPDGSVYDTYSVTDAIDISIPNASAGQWTYQTTTQCASVQSYDIETGGSGTGMLVGRVMDAISGSGLQGASISCNTGGATVSLAQGYFSTVAVAGTGVVTTAKTGYQTNVKVEVHIKAGNTTNLNIQVIPQGTSAQPVPSGIHIFNIVDPGDDPKPPTQPFAAKVSGTDLELNAIVPQYQQPVDVYLGFTINDGQHLGKLFLLDENDSVVELTSTLYPWRKGISQGDSAQVLKAISSLYPMGSYTLYSLVTPDSSTLSSYDLSFFTTTVAQPAPIGQNLSYIPNPAGEPNPLIQPLAVKITGGNLILNAHFPIQKEPVTIFLAYTTPGGQLYLIKPDGSRQLFTDTLWFWREEVTEEVATQVFSVPVSQITPGPYYFYSLVTTDPVALSNYDLLFFLVNVTE
jgi:hypothetical protein